VLTAALIIGVVVSLALTELIGLSPGGIIVPGYVALLLDRPLALAAFLMVALLSYGRCSCRPMWNGLDWG
jgi:hypothetical protein